MGGPFSFFICAGASAYAQLHSTLLAKQQPRPAPVLVPTNDNTRVRGRGRGNGSGVTPAPSTPPAVRPPFIPAPTLGANSWTGLVQAWPMPWRAPGSGVLGPRPGTPPQQAMLAAPTVPALPPYGNYAPGAPAGYGYPNTGYGHPGAGPSSSPSPAWDMASLQAALHSATAGPSSSSSTSEWYLDSGAASHMSSSPGNLLSAQPYLSDSQVIVRSGERLSITHVGIGSLISGTSPSRFAMCLSVPPSSKTFSPFVKYVVTIPFPLSLTFLVSLLGRSNQGGDPPM